MNVIRPLSMLLAILAGAALLLIAYVYGVSEWKMRRTYDAPLTPLRTPTATDPVAGMHMAKVVGCWAGCHGKEGEGGVASFEGVFAHTAPPLSAVVPSYSDAELVRLIRYGVKRDGRSAIGMTSYTLWPLGDEDLANIIAHLRGQPVRPPTPRTLDITFLGRLALATGKWKVSAEQVDRSITRWGELPRDTPFERGRYLASITCSECHGLDFRGDELVGAPSLAIVAAYQPAQFQYLMRTGKALSGRDIPAMRWLQNVDLSDQEIYDLYAFLREYHGVATVPDSAKSDAQPVLPEDGAPRRR